MPDQSEVVVYNFRVYEGSSETAQTAVFKATLAHISAIPGAKVLEGTGERVPVALLDADGRYRRRATGWGEL